MNKLIKINSLCLFILFSFQIKAQSLTENIRINQVGYYPNAPKVGVFVDKTEVNSFFITTPNFKDTIYRGTLSEPMQSKNSSLVTRIADFSGLQKQGLYVMIIPEIGHSYPFKIGNKIHHDAAVASLKGYYYQRISMPLEAKYAGKWARPAGHADTEVLIHPSAATNQRPAGTKIASPGGWYDAGDYNKYIVNSGITMGTLLSAYEDFTPYFDKLNTNIPESGDKVPDLLNEIIYNLRWMLTMQDPNDGGVYNKCTNADFDGMDKKPGETTLPRYVVQKGTAATLDFAAVAAQASRILKKYNKQLPGLSDSCLVAAKHAWQWALQHPDLAYNQDKINQQYEPKITTGGYGDGKFTDEWFWAASELYVTTKDEQYYKTITEQSNHVISLPTWNQVFMLGCYTLVRHGQNLKTHRIDIEAIKKKIVTFADTYLPAVKENAFQTVMGQNPKEFNWGSSSNAANQGILLINAYFITKDEKYINYALTNLDYLLGRNATGYSFLTGIGSKSPMHPHHRPSVADNVVEPVPGLLAGGPNPGRQDGCQYEFTEPETAYTDHDCSYASNEIAINWNAPMVYLAAAMEALQKEVKYSK
jgi:endoglucanase